MFNLKNNARYLLLAIFISKTRARYKQIMAEYQLFDISTIRPTDSVLIVGSQNRGKSTMCCNIVNSLLPHLDKIQYYSTMDLHAYNLGQEYDFIHRPNTRAVHGLPTNEYLAELQNSESLNTNYLVLDDVMYSKESFTNTVIKSILLNGRRMNIGAIVAINYIFGMSPVIRESFNYVFLYYTPIISKQKHIWEQFASEIYPTFNEFMLAMQSLRSKYSALVICRNGNQSGVWLYNPGNIPDSATPESLAVYLASIPESGITTIPSSHAIIVGLDAQCAITMSCFQPGDLLAKCRTCVGVFHIAPLLEWLKNNTTCPYCRHRVTKNPTCPTFCTEFLVGWTPSHLESVSDSV